jgi:hypothetical protein
MNINKFFQKNWEQQIKDNKVKLSNEIEDVEIQPEN